MHVFFLESLGNNTGYYVPCDPFWQAVKIMRMLDIFLKSTFSSNCFEMFSICLIILISLKFMLSGLSTEFLIFNDNSFQPW